MRAIIYRRAALQLYARPARHFSGRRWYNSDIQGHKTYFQDQPPPPPPPRGRGRKFLRTLLFGTACAVVGAGALSWSLVSVYDQLEEEVEQGEQELAGLVHDAHGATLARQVPALQGQATSLILNNPKTGYSITPTAVSHFTQLHSNLPCEDTMSSGTYTFHSDHYNDSSRDWSEWSIFDGHAGPRTSNLLQDVLPWHIGGELWESGSMNRPYTPNDKHIIDTIKRAFIKFDNDMFEAVRKALTDNSRTRADVISLMANVMSGSCALYAVFDPKNSVIRVANVGDSRAVLGRWDPQQGKYVAKIMSIDQTGFNQAEVERINSQHPGEDVIDPKTGRVLGIMVSRAFGDARWKWPQHLNKLAYDKFWGPKPRPDDKVLTPPYLTAEPDVMETKIQGGDHPDFMIMASDGFWDKVSNDDAITCVQMWLDKHKPVDFLENDEANSPRTVAYPFTNPTDAQSTLAGMFPKPPQLSEKDDVYFDSEMGTLQWHTSQKNFVVEDDNCGVHLLRNALGGNRRELFDSVVTVQPPLSRNVRDDISINVIFFGVNVQAHADAVAQAHQPAAARERSASLSRSLRG